MTAVMSAAGMLEVAAELSCSLLPNLKTLALGTAQEDFPRPGSRFLGKSGLLRLQPDLDHATHHNRCSSIQSCNPPFNKLANGVGPAHLV